MGVILTSSGAVLVNCFTQSVPRDIVQLTSLNNIGKGESALPENSS